MSMRLLLTGGTGVLGRTLRPLFDPSALAAEEETERFGVAGGPGIVLRFGLLDGPDAGRALLSRAAGWCPQA